MQIWENLHKHLLDCRTQIQIDFLKAFSFVLGLFLFVCFGVGGLVVFLCKRLDAPQNSIISVLDF